MSEYMEHINRMLNNMDESDNCLVRQIYTILLLHEKRKAKKNS